MAGKTPTEKIGDLFNLVATLTAQLDALKEEVKGIDVHQDKMSDSFSDAKTRLALVEQQIAELKAGKEERARRLWTLLVGIVLAVVGGVVGYLLKR